MKFSRSSLISDAFMIQAIILAFALYHYNKIPAMSVVVVTIIAVGTCIINYYIDNYRSGE